MHKLYMVRIGAVSRKGGIYSCAAEEICGRGFHSKDERSNRELRIKEQNVD